MTEEFRGKGQKPAHQFDGFEMKNFTMNKSFAAFHFEELACLIHLHSASFSQSYLS